MTRRKQYLPCVWLMLAGVVSLLLLSIGLMFALKILGQFVPTYQTYPDIATPASEPSVQELDPGSLPLQPLWDSDTPMPIDRAPRFVEDIVLLEGDKTLVGLDPTTGEMLWSFEVPGSVDDYTARSMVVKGHYVAFRVLPGGALYVVNTSTGKLAWKTDTPVKEFDIGEDKIFIKIVDARYEVRSVAQGNILWTFEPIKYSKRSAVKYHNKQLFIWEGDENYILNSETGEVTLHYEGKPYSSPVASLAYDGVFFAVESSPKRLLGISKI